MSYRFRANDGAVDAAVRRIAREQVDGALAAIARKHADKATHEVRKACKKVRALIRLVRPCFAEFKRENAAFRDLARLLSGSRDAKVLLDTFDLLAADAPEQDTARFARLRRGLAPGRHDAADEPLEQARAALEAARERIDGWTLDADGWDAIGPGLQAILRGARQAARTVVHEPVGEHYHELRKLMKHHWYHARLLEPLWPGMMKPRAAELSRLADLLGLHHDICVFAERLADVPASGREGEAAEALLELAAARRVRLEREIAPLTARLLAQKPRAVAVHWQALWRIWRGEGAVG